MLPNTVIGSVTGTGAAINVVLGFVPDYVQVVHRLTGAKLEKFRGATTTIKTVSAGTKTVAAGITSYESNTTGEGFTIPVDATVNINTNVIDYIAVRSGAGSK